MPFVWIMPFLCKTLHKKENICIFALKINHKINNYEMCKKNRQNNN